MGAVGAAMSEVRMSDVEIIEDAVQQALGPRQFALVADYLGARDANDDSGNRWMVPEEFDVEPCLCQDFQDF